MSHISAILSLESLSKMSLCVEDFSLSLDLLYLIAFKVFNTLTCFSPWSSFALFVFQKLFLKENK